MKCNISSVPAVQFAAPVSLREKCKVVARRESSKGSKESEQGPGADHGCSCFPVCEEELGLRV